MQINEPPEDAYEWTASAEKAPDTPEVITIGFEAGVPVSVNGKTMKPLALIEEVNKIAGKHGVGRIDHIEDRVVGFKSREVYECPAALVILDAHHDLEKMVMTRNQVLFKQQIDDQWVYLAYSGFWVDPLKRRLRRIHQQITGKRNRRSQNQTLQRQHANHRTQLTKLTLQQKPSQLQHQNQLQPILQQRLHRTLRLTNSHVQQPQGQGQRRNRRQRNPKFFNRSTERRAKKCQRCCMAED